MPWNIRDDHPDCSGFAVVKTDDGELVACHDTRAQAEKHMAALYANEPQARSRVLNPDQFFAALALVPNLRSAQFNDLEIERKDSGGFRFQGHAAVFDEEAEIDDIPGVGKITESVHRGAFRKVLQQPANIPLTLEHDPTRVLATTKSGRLKLSEDTKGLAVDADLPDTSLSRDLYSLVESDVVRGMSFGFVVGPKANWKVERRTSGMHRSLFGFKKLLDVCTTWDPTYPSAEAQFRSQALRFVDSPESWQQLLMGAYPQLGERAEAPDGTGDETPGTEPAPDEEPQIVVPNALSGVAERRSVAARKRALQFYILTEGGIDDASR